MRARVGAPNRKQPGQAHHEVAEPVNFLDEDARRRRLQHHGGRRRRRRPRIELVFVSDIFGFQRSRLPAIPAMPPDKDFITRALPNKPGDWQASQPPPRAGKGNRTRRKFASALRGDRTSIRSSSGKRKLVDCSDGWFERSTADARCAARRWSDRRRCGCGVDRTRSRHAFESTFQFCNFGARHSDAPPHWESRTSSAATDARHAVPVASALPKQIGFAPPKSKKKSSDKTVVDDGSGFAA